jgi:rSAM/selenodomain-associated transferase 1
MKKSRIIIFAKAPLPGLAKTRLIPALGAEGAARLARRMLDHSLYEALAAGADAVELCMTPHPKDKAWLGIEPPPPVMLSDQGDGILGERLARASERALSTSDRVVLIGTDCPTLDAAILRDAIEALQTRDAVMVPAMDGGYVLLGFKRFDPGLFEGIAWSTSSVAEATRQKIAELSWRLREFTALRDIDEPEDLQYLPEGWI